MDCRIVKIRSTFPEDDIHFLARSRSLHEETGSWARTVDEVFGEPARAIVRNIVVLAVGFLPLLLAPLLPYQTVGVFIATILLFAGACTLLLLPALMTVLSGWLFDEPKVDAKQGDSHE